MSHIVYGTRSRRTYSFVGAQYALLGDDHVLVVTRHGYSERYARCYYSDILCTMVHRMPRTLHMRVIFWMVIVALVVLSLMTNWMVCILSIVAVVVYAFGEALQSRTVLTLVTRTGARTVRIRSLHQARAFAAELREQIEQIQGHADQAELANRYASIASPAISAEPLSPAPAVTADTLPPPSAAPAESLPPAPTVPVDASSPPPAVDAAQ